MALERPERTYLWEYRNSELMKSIIDQSGRNKFVSVAFDIHYFIDVLVWMRMFPIGLVIREYIIWKD